MIRFVWCFSLPLLVHFFGSCLWSAEVQKWWPGPFIVYLEQDGTKDKSTKKWKTFSTSKEDIFILMMEYSTPSMKSYWLRWGRSQFFVCLLAFQQAFLFSSCCFLCSPKNSMRFCRFWERRLSKLLLWSWWKSVRDEWKIVRSTFSSVSTTQIRPDEVRLTCVSIAPVCFSSCLNFL